MEEIILTPHYEKLQFMHFFLAFAGAMIFVLQTLQKKKRKGEKILIGFWLKDNWMEALASVIMIPTVLIMATDPTVEGIIPINYVTAVLAGWNIHSIFYYIIKGRGPK